MDSGVMGGGGPVCDITARAGSSLSKEDFVGAEGEVVVNGKLAGFDDLVCRIVVEARDADS